jgi:hypothetical protein
LDRHLYWLNGDDWAVQARSGPTDLHREEALACLMLTGQRLGECATRMKEFECSTGLTKR